MAGTGALPAFSYGWVGGDIHGLSALAGQCSRIAPQIGDAASVLTTRAEQLSCTAGWEGKAASAFTDAWAKDSGAGSQLAGMWEAISQIVGTLAVELAALENALERAAAQVEAKGIAVNPGTGNLEPTIMAARGAAAARISKLMGAYTTFRAAVLARAKAYRAAAAAELEALAGGVLPGPGGGGIGGAGSVISLLSKARQLWATPTAFRVAAEKRLPDLEQAAADAWEQAKDELLAVRKLNGKGARMPAAVRDQLRSATQELDQLESQIEAAGKLESFGSQVAAGQLPDALVGVLDGAGSVVRAIPVAGTVAGAAATVVNDILTGHSVGHGLLDAAASTGAGYGAGAGVAAAIGTGTLGATAAGAAGAVTVGAAAGDFAHHLVGDIGPDVSKDGLLKGTGVAIGDSASQTVHDIEHVISGII